MTRKFCLAKGAGMCHLIGDCHLGDGGPLGLALGELSLEALLGLDRRSLHGLGILDLHARNKRRNVGISERQFTCPGEERSGAGFVRHL